VRSLHARAQAGPLTGIGLAGTLGLHLAVLGTFWVAGLARPRPLAPVAYRVNLVAAPPPATAAAPAPAAQTTTPAPTPAAPAARRPEAPPASRTKAQPAAPPAPTPAAQRTAPAVAAPSSPVAGPATSTTAGTDAATIRTEGVDFPFPGYLHNLVTQVYQRWSPPLSQAALNAEVLFFIHRDGRVTGLQFIRRSGSFGFDLEAQGAIESAARAGSFGPLPDGFGQDVLPVSFFFNPRGR
jgi:protein TonB